ncbi:MAG TPA: bifunctional DNA primase/polymerase [Xanthobacteraceae bacterium]|nr:bifunctional DNA primase/polymerase [Xanthobacteraceae bacterium]
MTGTTRPPKILRPSFDRGLALAKGGTPIFPGVAWWEWDEEAQKFKLKKFPAISKENGGHGHLDATYDLAAAQELFARAQRWNIIGMPTGEVSGIDIIDTDLQHESARDWLARNPLPITPIQHTPQGGRHYLFKHRPGQRNTTATPVKGIDVRGDGSFVWLWFLNGYPVENWWN